MANKQQMMVLMFCSLYHWHHVSMAQDVVKVSAVSAPMPLDTVPLATLDKEVPHHAGGEWPKDWVATPVRPVVIRQGEKIENARYHEVTGYTFLINSLKRPRLVRMESGRLVLVATAWLHQTGTEVGIILTSDNAGKNWSQPREIIHGTLVNLGGSRLCVFDGDKTTFSYDDGETWSETSRSAA